MEEYFVAQNDKKFRATQIFEWLYRHRVTSFSEMTNLSKKALEHLNEHFAIERLPVEKKLTASDGTTKYLFRLHDGHLIETVLMRHSYGNSVCVTSQVGCNMGCSFCASGELGKIRNLTHAEMVLQVLHVQSELDATNEPVTNIVVMGIGEPFDKFDTDLDFCRTVNFAKGLKSEPVTSRFPRAELCRKFMSLPISNCRSIWPSVSMPRPKSCAVKS